ncbi:DUF1127 domain-containing protein [Aureimonas psammosilenae]|uniref:DUF1127 domain-containing protein n=1 Tax=Aureimonas psammosilenae TaxID=2495496 RepID=UPI001260D55B|nr:DUF1127 domain-containing protein [Aureimonas psammosilenae]
MSILPRTLSGGLSDGLPSVHVAFAAVAAMARSFRNHRAARHVGDLPDYLLTDIGLKRDDVSEALSANWRDDPTFRLAMRAAERRRAK